MLAISDARDIKPDKAKILTARMGLIDLIAIRIPFTTSLVWKTSMNVSISQACRPATAGPNRPQAGLFFNKAMIKSQAFRFPSFPRKRESSEPPKKLDTRFHGYDDQRFQRKS